MTDHAAVDEEMTQLFSELMEKCRLAHAAYWCIYQTLPSPHIAYRCRQLALSYETLYFKLVHLSSVLQDAASGYAFEPEISLPDWGLT